MKGIYSTFFSRVSGRFHNAFLIDANALYYWVRARPAGKIIRLDRQLWRLDNENE